MKRLEVFLLPLDGMLVHHRSLPCNLSGFPTISLKFKHLSIVYVNQFFVTESTYRKIYRIPIISKKQTRKYSGLRGPLRGFSWFFSAWDERTRAAKRQEKPLGPGWLVSHTCPLRGPIFTACKTTRFFPRQTPVSARACIACWKEIIRSDVCFTFKHLDGLSLCLKCWMTWKLESSSFTSKLSTQLEYSGHRRAELASISRSWIIKKLQITGFVANQLRSGRPAKLSVDPKSIYRSTDAKTWWQTFLVKKCFFLQSSRKNEDRSAFK